MRIRRQPVSIASLAIVSALCLRASSSKLYELRLYTANAGKLADFQTVFRNQALPLFAKYGIENVFDATVLEGARVDGSDAGNMLVCVFAHQSRAAADRSWAAVEGDANGHLALLAKPAVSIFMTPTDFSPPLEAPTTGSTTRVFELRKYNTGPGGLPRTVDQFKSGLAAILSKNGMTPITYWTADDHSAFIYLLAHKDREAARTSWASFVTDFRPFMAEFNARVPAPPAGTRQPDDNRSLFLPTSRPGSSHASPISTLLLAPMVGPQFFYMISHIGQYAMPFLITSAITIVSLGDQLRHAFRDPRIGGPPASLDRPRA